MTFLHPIILWSGLACVGIPILIHFLMRRRRRPVLFGAMRFLLEALRRHQRRLRLEQILLLAARCLLVALIAAGLARPASGGDGSGSMARARTLFLLVDTSIAASAVGDNDEPAIERHKAAARSLLGSLEASRGDRAALIALGAPAWAPVSSPSGDLSGVRSLVDALEAGDAAMDLAGGAMLARDAIASMPAGERSAARVVVLSDFLAGCVAPDEELPAIDPAGEGVEVLASEPAAAGADTIGVESLEPMRSVVISGSGLGENLATARLVRSGPWAGQAGVTRVGVRALVPGRDEGPAGSALVRWAPGQREASVGVSFALSGGEEGEGAGGGVLVASIDADSIAGDNTFRRPIEVRERLRVGVVFERRFGEAVGIGAFGPADWVRLALDPGASLVEWGDRAAGAALEPVAIEPTSVDATHLGGLSAVVVTRPDSIEASGWSVLGRFARAGGLVVVFAPEGGDAGAWGGAMTAALGLPWRLTGGVDEDRGSWRLAWPDRAAEARGNGLFELLRAEFDDLARGVSVSRAIRVEAPESDVALALDDRPFVVSARPGATDAGEDRGLVVLVATALDFGWTDLMAKPLLVPLVQEMIRQGAGEARGSGTMVAGGRASPPSRVVELVAEESGEVERRPRTTGGGFDAIRRAGVWRGLDDRGGEAWVLGVNADARAAAGDASDPGVVSSWLADLARVPGEAAGSSRRVRWLAEGEAPGGNEGATTRAASEYYAWVAILGALGLALVEVLMARYFSHAGMRTTRRAAGVARGGVG